MYLLQILFKKQILVDDTSERVLLDKSKVVNVTILAKDVCLFLNANRKNGTIQTGYTHWKGMKLGGDMTEVADEFVYLGTCINKHREKLKDRHTRTGLANKAYYS